MKALDYIVITLLAFVAGVDAGSNIHIQKAQAYAIKRTTAPKPQPYWEKMHVPCVAAMFVTANNGWEKSPPTIICKDGRVFEWSGK